MRKSTKRLVTAALLTALVCVATLIIRIPSPFKGYINLGDCIVLLAGWLLPPGYGFLTAGIGSALADLISGYAVYMPATFVIKGFTALTAYMMHKLISRRLKELPSGIISGIIAETVMTGGYYLFEGILYGFAASAVNIPMNLFQGAVGIILGVTLVKIIKMTKITF